MFNPNNTETWYNETFGEIDGAADGEVYLLIKYTRNSEPDNVMEAETLIE